MSAQSFSMISLTSSFVADDFGTTRSSGLLSNDSVESSSQSLVRPRPEAAKTHGRSLYSCGINSSESELGSAIAPSFERGWRVGMLHDGLSRSRCSFLAFKATMPSWLSRRVKNCANLLIATARD